MSTVIQSIEPVATISNITLHVDMHLDHAWDDNELDTAIGRLMDNLPGIEKVESCHGGGQYLTIDYDDYLVLGHDTYMELLEHTSRCVEAMVQLYLSAKNQINLTSEALP